MNKANTAKITSIVRAYPPRRWSVCSQLGFPTSSQVQLRGSAYEWFRFWMWFNSTKSWTFRVHCQALKRALASQRHDPQAANNHLIWLLSKTVFYFHHCCGHWCHFNSQNVDSLFVHLLLVLLWVCECLFVLQPSVSNEVWGCFWHRDSCGALLSLRSRICWIWTQLLQRGAFYSRWGRRVVGSFPSLLTSVDHRICNKLIHIDTNWYKLQQIATKHAPNSLNLCQCAIRSPGERFQSLWQLRRQWLVFASSWLSSWARGLWPLSHWFALSQDTEASVGFGFMPIHTVDWVVELFCM